jgi:MYXO-CTERM domain-containing protein
VVALGPFLLLLFPDGRLPGRRWRPVAWTAAALLAAIVVASAVLAWPVRGTALYRAMVASTTGIAPVNARLTVALFLVAETLLVVGAVGLLLRLRRLRGAARQQTKWFAFGAIPWVAADLISGFLPPFAGGLGSLVALSGLLGAITVAVFRYQLYDIDRLINRTLVYALLTALLGLGYVAGSLLFVQVAGAGSDPPNWLIAAATLAAAAVFRPARRRIQAVVDRRFNRRRYNAAQTIEAFSTRLRDEVDLDTLSAELVAVAGRTMEPTTLSLWLRPPLPRSERPAS